MRIDDQTKTGLLRLRICEGTRLRQLKAAAASIRGLPGVMRVAIDQAAGQMDILFVSPAVGLLREIHAMLRLAGTDMAASKVF